jgi:hypothetical protein
LRNITRATNEAKGEAVAVQAPVPVPIVVCQRLVSTPSPSPVPPAVRLGQLRRHDSDGKPHLFSTFPPSNRPGTSLAVDTASPHPPASPSRE